MSKFFLITTALVCLITGCSGSDNDSDNTDVTPFVQNPEDGAVDVDDFIVFSATIDFYESRFQSCDNPRDSQFLGLTKLFDSKPLVCIRYTIDARANREATVLTNFSPAIDDTDFTTETLVEEFNGSTVTTVTRRIQLTPENMGPLPAVLTASIEVLNAFDDPIPLVTEVLTATGSIESNDPNFPDGTELVVINIPPPDENSPTPNPGILTRYRDLPLDGNFCVNHDIFIEVGVDPFAEVLQLASGLLLPDEFGQLRAVVEIPRPTELNTYLARVFPLSASGACDVNAAPIGPSIIYRVEP